MTGPSKIKGIPAAPGIALGKASWLRPAEVQIEKRKIDSPETEINRVNNACENTVRSIRQMQAQLKGKISSAELALFDAHIMILEDPDLLARVASTIKEEKVNAEFAWEQAVQHYTHEMETLDNEYFRARAMDIRDVGRQVLLSLLGLPIQNRKLEEPAVILAIDLTPSDTVELDRSKVLGFCTIEGSATSHTAIIAKALNLPAVVGTGNRLADVLDGTFVILDGITGEVILSPDPSLQKNYRDRLEKEAFLRADQLKNAHTPAVTRDGFQAKVVANIGSLEEAAQANEMGAEGIGLLRTEFLFMGRKIPPAEEEQFTAYRSIFQNMGDCSLVVRTLDIGGDKCPSYMDLGKETNPFLGWRAIRICLARPDFFKVQLRALLRAGVGHDLQIMFPMIATLEEFRQAKALLVESGKELASEGVAFKDDIKTGIMVEIPSAAVMADQFAKEVDFFSIGTNDLTQYLFAIDRTNAKVAHIADAIHPAVLRQIKQVIEAAHSKGIWVGVCGELAGDLDALPILLGLGVDEFSMTPVSIPAAKATLCSWSKKEATRLALEAINLESSRAIRAAVQTHTGA